MNRNLRVEEWKGLVDEYEGLVRRVSGARGTSARDSLARSKGSWDECGGLVGESRAVIDGGESVDDHGTGLADGAIVVTCGGRTAEGCSGREDFGASGVLA